MAPLGVKAARSRDSLRIRVFLVVDMKIKVGHTLRSIVTQRDPRAAAKGHFEIAVHGAVLHRDRQRDPRLVFLSTMSARNIFILKAGPEEVADRDLDARIGFAV